MDYNNYYPPQSGHPPPNMSNQQHGGPQMQQQQPPQGGQMMHSPMPNQNIRQAMPPGPHQQQMQQMQSQQQNMGHHPQQQQMPPQQPPPQQQQQHQNYHQIRPPHQHGPPVSHSSSPHPQQQPPPPPPPQQQQQQQHHNHQPTIPVQLPQQSAMPPQHMHPQSPHHHHHHHGGPPIHTQQQQSLNQMVRPPLGPPGMNHSQPGPPQPIHHQQNFSFNNGPPIPQSGMHHYPQQNQHHTHHQPQHPPHPQHPHHHQHPQHPQHPHPHHGPPHPHQRPQPPIMHQHHHHDHHAPPMAATHHPHMQPGIGRSSPYYPNLSQTEFRIIELNKRLQCRPINRHPVTPLPTPHDESLWWERFASEFFEDDATLTLRTQEDTPVEYTIGRTLIPRFFKTYFDGGVTDLSINLRNPKEACLNPQTITLDCDQAIIITNNIFRHPAIGPNQGVVVHTEGHLILDFVSNSFDTFSIKSWRFYTKGCREYIDRSILATMGMSNNYLAEPVTRNGLTKSTISYLKMCMIMEPMQDLMFQHKQTRMDPRSCLQKLLFDRYKYKSSEDTRVAKRRKRKPSSAPTNITGGPATTNKKTKANINNSMGNNSGLNNNNNSNNMLMSQSGPGFSLASQDVMVVGEPSMMGGDFGDDNERMITRLENTQYDPSASTPSNADESDSMNAPTGNDNGVSNSNNNNINMDIGLENHIMSPNLVQQRQSQQQISEHHSSPSQQNQLMFQHVQTSPSMLDQQPPQQQQPPPPPPPPQINEQDLNQETGTDSSQLNQTSSMNQQNQQPQEEEQHQQTDLEEHQPQHPQAEILLLTEDDNQISQMPTSEQTIKKETSPDSNERPVEGEQLEHQPPDNDNHQQQQQQQLLDQLADIKEETKVNSIASEVVNNDSGMMMGVNSVEQVENHNNSIQNINDESNSNSQLPCSTATTNSAMEQQQPVDNGVA